MSIIHKNYFVLPGAFCAGYALHYINGEIIQFARETFHIQADLYQGLSEEVFRKKYLEQLKGDAPPGTSPEAFVKTEALYQVMKEGVFIIFEEIVCRHYLQKCLLPPLLGRITSSFTKPLAVVVSALSFSLLHLGNTGAKTPAVKQALLIHTFILGLIAGFASEKLSLKAAIMLHLGYNARSWKRCYLLD